MIYLFQYESNEHRTKTENQTTPHKTTNNKPPHFDDEITKEKKLDLCENHLFRLKYREKDEDEWFQVKN